MSEALCVMSKSIDAMIYQIASLQCDVNEIRTLIYKFEASDDDERHYSTDASISCIDTPKASASIRGDP